MTRVDFLNRLSALISDLPDSERNKAIAYYSEIIADKVENGENEDKVIEEFGDVKKLAQEIRGDNNYNYQGSFSNMKKKKPMSPWLIVLIILASPILFGLAMGVFGIAISVLAVAFSIVFAFFISSVVVGLSGVAVFLTSFITIIQNPTIGVMQMGAGLVCSGISVFLFFATFHVTKAIMLGTKSLFGFIKRKTSKKQYN